MDRIAQWLTPLNTGLAAGAGGIAFGGFYISISGFVLGIVLVLGALGLLAVLVSLVGQATGQSFEPAAAGAGAAGTALHVNTNPTRGIETAMASSSSGSGADSKIVESTLPAGAPIEAVKIEATETEVELLNAGRFADYHLAKARRLFEAKNYKEAAYQAAASLAHGDLAAAKELRAKARALLKG